MNNSGFTLLEVTVAVLLTALIAGMAHGILAEVIDASETMVETTRDADRRGNRRNWLVRAVASIETSSRPRRGFVGLNGWSGAAEADHLTFETRHAWQDHSVARVSVHRASNGRLIAVVTPSMAPTTSGSDSLALADSVGSFGAEYLLELGSAAQWVEQWISPVSAPLAVRLRIRYLNGQADTLLLAIGSRG